MITRLILAIGWCWTIGCLAASGGEAVAQKTNLISNHGIQLPRTLPLSGYGLVPALGGLRFGNPVVIACPPGETNRLFLAERAGRVLVVTNLTEPTATVFLDVRVRTYSTYPEAGLLGLTFHPGFGTNGYFYVFRSLIRDTAGHPNALHEQVSRFSASPIDPNQALVDSELVLIAQPDHSPEHNGGDLKFGPDGYLYISFGNNGPSPNDRSEQVQPIDGGFFGAIARIDVDQRPENLRPNLGPATSPFYSIPRDNPFVGVHEHEGVTVDPAKVRTEFYAIGLRNPWRMSFDPVTGSLFCGDVGASAWEEINLIRKGGNYGWPYLEGNDGEVPQGLMTNPPLWTYPHGYNSQQGIAVIGGLICQDASLPALEGAYVFGDYGSGSVWSLRVNTLQRTASNWEYLTSEPGICAFGTDPSTGQILVANHTKGTIQKLVYQSPDAGMAIPQTLYQTGLFTDLIQLQPRAGMIPYQVNAPFWSDQALKSRWFCLPEGTQIQFRPDSNWEFPPGTVWVKHFELELTNGVAASRRRMETRVLVKTPDDVYGLTYRWGRTLDRPTLAPVAGLDEELLIDDGGTTRTQTWHYPSRVQCLGCHTAQGGFALGFNTAQLNLAANSTPAGNQLNYLNSLGCFENLPVLDSSRLPHLAATAATNSPLGHRARSYLTANCSYCHQPGAPAGQSWDARITTPLPLARMINTPASPLPSTLISPVWFLAPRSPEASMILQWMNRRGPLQMPPLATTLVDSNGVQLLTEWIDSFAPDPWQESVIGTPRIQGYTACQNGSFVLSASGGGSYEAADGLYFLSTGLEGSGQILTRLVSFNAAAADAKK